MNESKSNTNASDKLPILNKLWKDAKYAAASYSVELMCQTYGELQMARMLGAVDYESTCDLNGYIVRDHINNGPWRRMCERQHEIPTESLP